MIPEVLSLCLPVDLVAHFPPPHKKRRRTVPACVVPSTCSVCVYNHSHLKFGVKWKEACMFWMTGDVVTLIHMTQSWIRLLAVPVRRYGTCFCKHTRRHIPEWDVLCCSENGSNLCWGKTLVNESGGEQREVYKHSRKVIMSQGNPLTDCQHIFNITDW